ncbi:hypothetical protein D3C86_1700460 [compost metagenome]
MYPIQTVGASLLAMTAWRSTRVLRMHQIKASRLAPLDNCDRGYGAMGMYPTHKTPCIACTRGDLPEITDSGVQSRSYTLC